MKCSEKTSEYLIGLLKAAVFGAELPLADDVDYAELFSLAKFHSVANIALYALEKGDANIPETLAGQWRELRDKAVVSDITFQMDYATLCQELEREQIRYLPLKGILMKPLYPQTDYRTMSDIDILIDPENAEKVRAVMERLGYDTASYDHDVHDVYHKSPVTSIEIHRELFGAEGEEYAPLFSDPWSECDVYSEHRYEFRPHLFFIYLLAHGMKHYAEGGTGIRTFLDISIFLKHYGGQTDIQEVCRAFDAVGQRQLCEQMISLSNMWFGDSERSEALSETEKYILSGGTYGTFSNQVENSVRTKGKAGYIRSKLFPDLKLMRQRYPVLRKAPVLLPVFWLVRICTKPFSNRRQNMEKLKNLLKK